MVYGVSALMSTGGAAQMRPEECKAMTFLFTIFSPHKKLHVIRGTL